MSTITLDKVEITQRGTNTLGITIPAPRCRLEGLHAHQQVKVTIEILEPEYHI